MCSKRKYLSDNRIRKKEINYYVPYVLWRFPLNTSSIQLRTKIRETIPEVFQHRCDWADWEKHTDVLSQLLGSLSLCFESGP